jgi:serine/threonine protein kinase
MPLGACGSVKEYDLVCRVGEGTYGTVYKARHLKTGQLYALKLVILHNEESDGVSRVYVFAVSVLASL